MIDKIEDRLTFMLKDFPVKRRNEILRNLMIDRVATPPTEPTSLREVWAGPTLTEQVAEAEADTETEDEKIERFRKWFETNECNCSKYSCGPFRVLT
jgi:hypothetical protein